MEETKKTGAKVQSRMAMIFSGVWIAALTVLKGFNFIKLDVTEIIYSGIAIAAVWTPTYFSIFLDKIKEIRFGGNNA